MSTETLVQFGDAWIPAHIMNFIEWQLGYALQSGRPEWLKDISRVRHVILTEFERRSLPCPHPWKTDLYGGKLPKPASPHHEHEAWRCSLCQAAFVRRTREAKTPIIAYLISKQGDLLERKEIHRHVSEYIMPVSVQLNTFSISDAYLDLVPEPRTRVFRFMGRHWCDPDGHVYQEQS